MKVELSKEQIISYKKELESFQQEILDEIKNIEVTKRQPFYQYLALISIAYENVDYGEMDSKSLNLIDKILKNRNLDNFKYFNIKETYFDFMDYESYLYKVLKGGLNVR